MKRPPPLSRKLLDLLLPEEIRKGVLADLEDAWRERGGGGEHAGRANWWYRRQALKAVGPALAERLRRVARPGSGFQGLDGLRQDVVFALRQLRRHPGIGVLVTVTLALGIGANTAIFSVVHGVLLRPLPYDDPGSLAVVTEEIRGTDDVRYLSGPDLVELEEEVPGITDAAALGEATVGPLGSVERPEHVKTVAVSGDLFRVLGVDAALGRPILPADGRPVETPEGVESPPAAAVLTDGIWRRSFGADPEVIGRVVRLWGAPVQIVGVLPSDFRVRLPPELNVPPDVEIVRVFRADLRDSPRGEQALRTVARLAPGSDIERVREQVGAFGARLRDREAIHAERGTRIRIESLPDRVDAPVRTPLLLLTIAVGLVLLIACANVANLLLARSTARLDELAVRSALGAGRRRVARQLLTECAVLVAVGTVAGLGLAAGGIRLLDAMRPPDLHGLEGVSLNGSVLLFTVALASVTTLLAGLLPALRGATDGRRPGLGLRRSVGRSRGAQGVLAAAQVALSVILLVGAGLMIRTFSELQAVPLGFEPRGVVTATATQPQTSVEDRQATEAALLREVRSLSGVRAAGIVFPLPMNGVYERTAQFAHPGREQREAAWSVAYFRTVSPTYFETMEIDLLRGRRLTRADEVRDVPVTVVDERLAEREWPGEDPIGRRLWVRNMRPDTVLFEVVGVVEHVPQADHQDPRPTLYFPRIHYLSHEVSLVARVEGPSAGSGPAIENRLRTAFPDIPVDVRAMEVYASRALASTRFLLTLMEVFAGMALLLAGVGLYGVLAYSVRQQRRELGVRKTFGAPSTGLVWLVLRRAGRISAIGLGCGLALSLLFGRLLESQLFRVRAHDPLVLGLAVTVVLVVALLAALLPGVRAARVDPMVALRTE